MWKRPLKITYLDSFNDLENPYYTDSNYDQIFGAPNLYEVRAFEEEVRYSQFAVQFEMPFENDFKINTQYFTHDVLEYNSNKLDLNLSLDNSSNPNILILPT